MQPSLEGAPRLAGVVTALRARIEGVETLHTPEMLFSRPLECGTAHLGVIRITDDTAAGMWERHDDGDELLLVFEGRIRMRVSGPEGDAVLDAGPGDLVFIAKGVAHTARILTDEVRLAFLSPATGTSVWRG